MGAENWAEASKLLPLTMSGLKSLLTTCVSYIQSSSGLVWSGTRTCDTRVPGGEICQSLNCGAVGSGGLWCGGVACGLILLLVLK